MILYLVFSYNVIKKINNTISEKNVFINLKSDSETTEIVIEDDGFGFPRDILSKIGEPYVKSNDIKDKSKTGLGLGLFIGKTLLDIIFDITSVGKKILLFISVLHTFNNL